MHDDSKRFFLRCLGDFLRGEPTGETPGVDWEEVFAAARAQALTAVIFYQCRTWIPREQMKKELRPYLAQAVYSFRQEAALKELLTRTEKDGVTLLCMKGAVFRDAYPIPALRSMGDMDLVVTLRDRDAVDRVLRQEMGYQRFIDNHDVWTYWKENIYFEVHTEMFYEYLSNDVDYRGYFRRVWEHSRPGAVFGLTSERLLVPEPGFHFLYLMTHTAKHMTNKGSGFRPYLDMVLTARAEELDWEQIRAELEKLKLLEFTRTCFSLCRRWFGAEMPLDPPELGEDFCAAATEKCFADGLFGLGNKENEGAGSAKELKRSQRPRWLTLIRLTVGKLFPPYRDMQLIPWYSFVDGRPWLLPFAWIYRWFYCLIHKRKAGMDRLTEPFVKKETVAAREDWLRQWGL